MSNDTSDIAKSSQIIGLNGSAPSFNASALPDDNLQAANDSKKVILFTGDNGTCHAVLNKLIPDLQRAGIEPVVLLTSGTNSPKAKIPEIKDFSFFESGMLKNIYDFLDHSDTLLDPRGKPRKDLHYSPNQLADLHQVHVEKISSVNDPDLIGQINTDPHIIGAVSIKNYKLFSEPAIEALKENDKFLWNVHTGELPQYRGVFIPVRVMQDDKQEYGWTLHDVDKGIDTGGVVDIRTTFLDDDDTALDAYYKMARRGSDMILDNVKLAAKHMPRAPLPQNHDEARYFSFPTAEEIQELADRDPPKDLVNEETAAQRYLDLFTDANANPAHAIALREVIARTIDDYKQGREMRPYPELYIQSDAGANATLDL